MEKLTNKIVKKIIFDIENDKNFMNKFLIGINEINCILLNDEQMKNDLFEFANCEKSNFDDFIFSSNAIKTYEKLFDEPRTKVLFTMYVPCDDDDNYIFVNEYYEPYTHISLNDDENIKIISNKIVIYYSQSTICEMSKCDEIDILNICDYKSLLNTIKNKMVELYG